MENTLRAFVEECDSLQVRYFIVQPFCVTTDIYHYFDFW